MNSCGNFLSTRIHPKKSTRFYQGVHENVLILSTKIHLLSPREFCPQNAKKKTDDFSFKDFVPSGSVAKQSML